MREIRCVNPFCVNDSGISFLTRSLDLIKAPDGQKSYAWTLHVDKTICHDVMFELTADAFKMMMGEN